MRFCISQNWMTALCVCLACMLCSCDTPAAARGQSSQGGTTLTVVNWNVETFFDSVTTGNEYDQFVSSKVWGKDAYVARLKRLCGVIQALDADIFVMEELENEGVLYDIYNFLSAEWDSRKLYPYGCFAKDEGSSIGCGVLSRHPLLGMTVHSLDIRTEGEAMPRMRPLMEVRVSAGGDTLTLMVSHWKSMLGGEETTEVWRLWQESVLSGAFSRNVAEGGAVIACGDYNRDISSFCAGDAAGMVRLRNRLSSGGIEVRSGWYMSDGRMVDPGSYYYNGWSRIDNFFCGGRASIVMLSAETDGPWYDSENGTPSAYKIWSGYGYSDHLPVRCVISF